MIHSCIMSCVLTVNTKGCFGSSAMFAELVGLLVLHLELSLFQCHFSSLSQLKDNLLLLLNFFRDLNLSCLLLECPFHGFLLHLLHMCYDMPLST